MCLAGCNGSVDYSSQGSTRLGRVFSRDRADVVVDGPECWPANPRSKVRRVCGFRLVRAGAHLLPVLSIKPVPDVKGVGWGSHSSVFLDARGQALQKGRQGNTLIILRIKIYAPIFRLRQVHGVLILRVLLCASVGLVFLTLRGKVILPIIHPWAILLILPILPVILHTAPSALLSRWANSADSASGKALFFFLPVPQASGRSGPGRLPLPAK